jgi:phosphoribosylanthranilate isomerase
MPKVKICGITNAQDALWAANLGADYIGLNFYAQSPRKVSVKHAKELVAQLPPFVTAIGLFVDEPIESIQKIVKSVPFKMVQLHGSESPEYCRQLKALGVKVMKAFRLEKALETADTAAYENDVDFLMFDTYSPDVAGGTGVPFDWDWLVATSTLTKPWFLAGGLAPGNILEAIKKTHASYVDVCSGVEKSPTRKDYEAMKTFIQAAKSVR